jgi:hypothetical protein
MRGAARQLDFALLTALAATAFEAARVRAGAGFGATGFGAAALARLAEGGRAGLALGAVSGLAVAADWVVRRFMMAVGWVSASCAARNNR